MKLKDLFFRCTNIENCTDVRIFEEGKKGFREENIREILHELGDREVDWFTITGSTSVAVSLYKE